MKEIKAINLILKNKKIYLLNNLELKYHLSENKSIYSISKEIGCKFPHVWRMNKQFVKLGFPDKRKYLTRKK